MTQKITTTQSTDKIRFKVPEGTPEDDDKDIQIELAILEAVIDNFPHLLIMRDRDMYFTYTISYTCVDKFDNQTVSIMLATKAIMDEAAKHGLIYLPGGQ